VLNVRQSALSAGIQGRLLVVFHHPGSRGHLLGCDDVVGAEDRQTQGLSHCRRRLPGSSIGAHRCCDRGSLAPQGGRRRGDTASGAGLRRTEVSALRGDHPSRSQGLQALRP